MTPVAYPFPLLLRLKAGPSLAGGCRRSGFCLLLVRPLRSSRRATIAAHRHAETTVETVRAFPPWSHPLDEDPAAAGRAVSRAVALTTSGGGFCWPSSRSHRNPTNR